jgi:hypothetical protein
LKIRTTTRPAVRAVALLALLIGGCIGATPTASAEGDVTVTWPEMTAFNADTTDYIVDVQWDGSGSLWLVDPGRSMDELPEAGPVVVDFPAVDPGGVRTLDLYRCPGLAWDGNCTIVSSSPELTVARNAGTHGVNPVASI